MERHVPGRAWPIDFDGDGEDELVATHLDSGVKRYRLPGPNTSLLFFDDNDEVVGQSNYSGQILPLHSGDVTGDGRDEVLVPVLRGDSLFVSFANGSGEKVGGFLLATGDPRVEADGVLPWDPRVREMWILDVDGDGDDELITVIQTAFARLPRGVLVHDPKTGERVGAAIVGAPPVASLIGDFDRDGRLELLSAAAATDNGASANGIDDSKGHLLLFELSPEPTVAWSRESAGDVPRLAWGRMANDSVQEVFHVRAQNQLTIEVLHPLDWTVRRRRTLTENTQNPILVDFDRDLVPEVVTLSPDWGTLQMVDDDLETVTVVRTGVHFSSPAGASPFPDLDGDDVEEVAYGLGDGFALIGPELKVKAIHANGDLAGVQRRGRSMRSRLLITREGGTDLAVLEANPWFWVYRFRAPVGSTVAVLIAALVAVQMRSRRASVALLRAIASVAMERGGRPLLVFDRDGVRWSSALLRPCPEPGTPIDSLGAELRGPAVLAKAALEASSGEASDTAQITLSGRVVERRLIATKVALGWPGRWFCIVLEAPEEAYSDPLPQGPWPLMAQRVAHRLKNSLSHMLLTTQRLQVEYQDRAPAVASRLDVYSDRIQQGIAQLRRETSNFLKLVDIDEPALSMTDINALIDEFGRKIRRRIPPDVRLVTDLAPELPPALVDREQIEEVLENLVSNAVNVMGVGGTVTIMTTDRTRLALSEDGRGGDWICIEVMDTGDGVHEEVISDLFEPGVSLNGNGTGLGLAIVRKIIRDHGGNVSYHTEAGVGTVFTLELPVRGPDSIRPGAGEEGG